MSMMPCVAGTGVHTPSPAWAYVQPKCKLGKGSGFDGVSIVRNTGLNKSLCSQHSQQSLYNNVRAHAYCSTLIDQW